MCDNAVVAIAAVITVVVFVVGLVFVAYIGSENKDQNAGGYQPLEDKLGDPPGDE